MRWCLTFLPRLISQLTATLMLILTIIRQVWEDMSPHFCTTFWSLTMYDLHVPESLYEKEIKKLKEAPAKLIENRDLNSSKRKKETDRLHALRERLQVCFSVAVNSVC